MDKYQRHHYLRLLGFVKPYWKGFLIAILGMLGGAATEPVFPALMKQLLDNGFATQDRRMVWAIPLGIVVLFLVRSVFVYCTGYLMMWISSHVVTDLRRAMFARLLQFPSAYFESSSSGHLISRLSYDVSQVSEAATSALVTLVRESMTALALLAYLLYLDWKLTLITLMVGPVIGLAVKSLGKRMRLASQRSLEAIRSISHTIDETVQAQKVVKIFGGQRQMTDRFDAATEEFRRAQMREAVPASASTPVTHIAASIAIAIIAFLALSQATGQASESAGGFVAFITAMLLLISPLKQLTTVNTTLQKGLTAAESVFALIDTSPEMDTGTTTLENAKGDIRFESVGFIYPSSETQALRDIDFHIPPGKTVALVGPSGGGKSTVSSLIPRFHVASSGRILIDDIDINDLTLASLRENIALVSQDVVLFNDTVEANIAFGARGAVDRKRVEDAARAANAWDFISQLPLGLETLIGANGSRLSGGQRQRIAIARALLKNAPILILDEATSALDNESERQVQAALSTLMKGRTTLVIAHRLSTIEHADTILFLQQGNIIERGQHSELVARQGPYAALISSNS